MEHLHIHISYVNDLLLATFVILSLLDIHEQYFFL